MVSQTLLHLQSPARMQGGLQPPSVEAELEALADSKRNVIFVLERANLEVAKVGKVRQKSCQSLHTPSKSHSSPQCYFTERL